MYRKLNILLHQNVTFCGQFIFENSVPTLTQNILWTYQHWFYIKLLSKNIGHEHCLTQTLLDSSWKQYWTLLGVYSPWHALIDFSWCSNINGYKKNLQLMIETNAILRCICSFETYDLICYHYTSCRCKDVSMAARITT